MAATSSTPDATPTSSGGGELSDGLDLLSSEHYGAHGPPHTSWTELRRLAPLHRSSTGAFPPFWAVTRHADICEISKRPDAFLSYPGITHPPTGRDVDRSEGIGAMRTIIEMDPPQHRSFRKVASPYFTPRALADVDAIVDASARHIVDGLVERAGSDGIGTCDVAADVAVRHPLRVLSTILGVAREREPDILRLTNQLFGADDEDLQRKGDDRDEAIRELGMELFQLFNEIVEDRRRNPRDDLATLLANGKVDGEPMPPMETFGYYLITFTAGHDTTKNALAGGIAELARNPREFAKLREDPERAHSAVEEIVRWTSPVNYMRRTASRDVDLRGQQIREGDHLILFYASANRDEEVFDEPFRFDVTRKPNPHVGFGHGEHFCLGAHLARRSQRALLRELATRVESLELTGEPTWIQSSFVVGYKHVPLRYRVVR